MLAHLATGGGKTVIFSELPKILNCRRTLVVAHRGELLTQAQDKLQDAGLTAEIEQAKNKASTDCPVVVASIQSLNTNGRLYKFNADEFDLVIIDECHHAAAKSYLRVVSHFSGAVILGFTATPYRSDDADLLEVFTDGVVFSMGIEELTGQGFLVPINKVTKLVPSMDAKHVLEAYKSMANGQKTIIFCHDVDHSMEVSRLFSANGVKSAFIHGGMDKEDRKNTLQNFSKDGIKVLANCNVLTEGYDEPSVQCIILARNTDSRSLYEQMIGRGTRLHESKTHLKVIELSVMPTASSPSFEDYPTFSPPPAVFSSRSPGYFMHLVRETFWVLVVLALLIGSFVGLGYAIKHCNQAINEIHSTPTTPIAPKKVSPTKKKRSKHGQRNHAHHSRKRILAERSSEVGL
jgi:superfamily II DNA or RNA helicase